MKQNNIHGKILALTQRIHLQEPEDGSGLPRQFFCGSGQSSILTGSIGLSWWITTPALSICEDIARMAMSLDMNLKGGDVDSFTDQIEKVLQETVNDPALFDWGSIFTMRAKTLFEARSRKEPLLFAKCLWHKIHQAFCDSVNEWLVLYPLHRVSSESTEIGFDGISLLASEDSESWTVLAETYPEIQNWSPSTGMRSGTENPFLFGPPVNTWLGCKVTGTKLGARRLAGRRMRTFISSLFSHLFSEPKDYNLLSKSMAQEISYAAQFPDDPGRAQCGQLNASIGTILPPLLIDIKVSCALTKEIIQWYQSRSVANEERTQRIFAASQFISYAIINDEIERFLHFFIALDSLFGERNKVEQGIINGITDVFGNDMNWVERLEQIYDLRNAIVHGQASLIEDWKGLGHYRRHFKSHPRQDVAFAAMKSYRRYFDL